MSHDKPENPSAFPRTWFADVQVGNRLAQIPQHKPGMYLLDYFAGLIAASLAPHDQIGEEHLTEDDIAVMAYDIAEALLAERSKRMENYR